jgi:hypothetical protein
MGCCESREGDDGKLRKVLDVEPSTTSEDLSTYESEFLREDIGRSVERKIHKIIEIAQTMTNSSDIWRHSYQDEHVTVQTAQGSPFNPSMPVAYLMMSFGKCVPAEDVLRTISVPSLRRGWDKDIVEMTVIAEVSPYEFLVRSVIDFKVFFLHKRECVERHWSSYEGDVARFIYYSIEHPNYPLIPDIMRQDVPFASITIEAKEDGTFLHFLLQFNNAKLNNSPVWAIAVQKLARWANRLRNEF